jgi:predicted lactoylglutathione lyase
VIDHIYLPVTDITRSVDFYTSLLGELGWRVIGAYDSTTEGVPSLYGFYAPNLSSIWLRIVDDVPAPYYVGIAVASRPGVDSIYATALDAGGTDAGQPAIRHYFSDGYYAANVHDPDGHTLEFANKG